MEPGHEDREDVTTVSQAVLRQQAAMEPGHEDREDNACDSAVLMAKSCRNGARSRRPGRLGDQDVMGRGRPGRNGARSRRPGRRVDDV